MVQVSIGRGAQVPTPMDSGSGIVAYDFFCGAGGATSGLLAAGIDVVCGVDTDAAAEKTYEFNNMRPNGELCRFVRADVSRLAGRHSIGPRCSRNGKSVVFVGCPPCQPFTNLKTDKSGQGDSRNLLIAFLRLIEDHLPEYIVVENVPGIQAAKYGGVFAEFTTGLERLNYHYDYGIVNAKWFGVPQSRRRMTLMASSLGPIRLPNPTHQARRYVPASIAFRFPSIDAGEMHPTVPNHRSAQLSPVNLQRIRVAKPGRGHETWPDELLLDCHKKRPGHTDVYGRMAPDHPAPTLTTRFVSLSNGRFGHPTEDRAISLREGAALQTFPDDFSFFGTLSTISRHIGNAVPVLMMKSIGLAIVEHYQDYVSENLLIESDALPVALEDTTYARL